MFVINEVFVALVMVMRLYPLNYNDSRKMEMSFS